MCLAMCLVGWQVGSVEDALYYIMHHLLADKQEVVTEKLIPDTFRSVFLSYIKQDLLLALFSQCAPFLREANDRIILHTNGVSIFDTLTAMARNTMWRDRACFGLSRAATRKRSH